MTDGSVVRVAFCYRHERERRKRRGTDAFLGGVERLACEDSGIVVGNLRTLPSLLEQTDIFMPLLRRLARLCSTLR